MFESNAEPHRAPTVLSVLAGRHASAAAVRVGGVLFITALTAAAAVAVLAVPALAAADRARPWEDPAARDFDREEEERSEFWERAIRPRHDEYDELVAGAQRRLGQQRDADGRAAAEAMLLRAVALEPDSPQAYWFLGALYAESARWEECASARQKIFDVDPDYRPEPRMGSPWALDLGLGECLGLAGHYERAIEHYQRILTTRQATGAFPVHWHLGEALMALGRLGEAIDALKTAAKLVGDREPLVHYALAVAYDRDEQLALSRDHMAIALARDPQLQNLLRDNLTFTPPADRWYYRGLANENAGRYAAALAGHRNERSILAADPERYALPRYYPYSSASRYPALVGVEGWTFEEMMLRAIEPPLGLSASGTPTPTATPSTASRRARTSSRWRSSSPSRAKLRRTSFGSTTDTPSFV